MGWVRGGEGGPKSNIHVHHPRPGLIYTSYSVRVKDL